ncbi:glycosyltransferase [Dactylosporangium sp. CS-047395]|uniref:glycosyltransferase n=1 Tax=Dactylosporangium sp. CS-047395 TaxID=3239936 RepID=UPI003D8C5EE7
MITVAGALLGLALLRAGLSPAVAYAAQLVVATEVAFLVMRTRWLRFHAARATGAAIGLGGFPLLADVIGPMPAYWLLTLVVLGVDAVLDRHWSVRAGRGRHAAASRPARVLPVVGTGLLGAYAVTARLDAVLAVISLVMLTVAITTLVFQLYKWWTPEHNDPGRYGEPDAPRLPGVILVPMRHEESVAANTLERLAGLRHPNYLVVPIIDHPDDPGTAAIAHDVARRHPGRVVVCRYPEDTDVHNKPIALNAAIAMLQGAGVRYEWVGVADAEDLFHPDLLRMVDYRFRTTGAGIVQCGVQLMNFASDHRGQPVPAGAGGRLRRWWRSNTSAWWRAANVLEYYKWFQSRLKLQAAIGVMPLGGNTVFFRRGFLEALHRRSGRYWDEACLTEDCKIGIVASVLGYSVDVVYVDAMVTQEETPGSLPAFVRQRVRWMQGFIQVFGERDWLWLPTLTQRVLAVYVLGFQFFQALTGLLAPVALAVALTYKAPIVITLVATLPLGLSALNIVLDVVLLAQFTRAFRVRARLRDYAGLVLGAYPYQIVLSIAAVWATCRFLTGRNDWVKTVHHGAHLPQPVPTPIGVAA